MEREQLLKWIQAGEGITVEFKPKLPSLAHLARGIAALANSKGGYILIGVEDNAALRGMDVTPEVLDTVAEAAGNLCRPGVEVETETVELNGKKVLVLRVPHTSTGPVTTDKGEVYVRVGRVTRRAMPAEIARLYMETRFTSFEESVVPGATVDDLAVEELERFLAHRGFERSAGDIPSEELLVNVRFAQNREGTILPTVAGMLLLGRDPQKFLPQSAVETARFQGHNVLSPVMERAELTGRLTALIDEVSECIKEHRRVASKIEGWYREDLPEYPLEAIQEAVVNAVAHRDYSLRGERIRIFLFDDRWEVISPGRLPGSVRVEALGGERLDRNPVIVDALRTFGYMEGMGTGIHRIRHILKHHGFREPLFEEAGDTVKVVFYGSGERLQEERMLSRSKRLLSGKENERQLRALAYLVRHDAITNRAYRELTGATTMTALRDLRALVGMGILERIGQKKSTYYRLSKEVTG